MPTDHLGDGAPHRLQFAAQRSVNIQENVMGAIAKAFAIAIANRPAQPSPREKRMGELPLNFKAGWLP